MGRFCCSCPNAGKVTMFDKEEDIFKEVIVKKLCKIEDEREFQIELKMQRERKKSEETELAEQEKKKKVRSPTPIEDLPPWVDFGPL